MATKFTAGTVINAGLIVVGVDADAPPATPSPAPESTNIALTATSTASTHISDRPPSLAHDGIIGISDTDGSTISGLNAWVTTGERVGAWMQLDWSTPQTVNKIKLYDRPNVTHDHIKGGTLTFSDGSSVTVGELPDGVVNGAPDPLEVTFDAKTITWVRFTVDAFTGHNAGLTEFEVFGYEYQAPAPEPAPESAPEPITINNSRLVSLLLDASVDADGSVVDGSTNSHAITVNGDVTQSSFSPYRSGGYSWEFDGSGDYLTVGDANLLDITSATQSFTVEAWVNPASRSVGGAGYRFSSIVSKGVVYVSFGITDTGALQFYTYNGGFNYITSTAGDIALNEWQHVAVVCDSGSITLYKNGTSIATGSLVVPTGGTNVVPKIGAADPAYASDFFDGKMADLRIMDGTVTAPTAAPTERLTEVAGTSLLTCNLPYLQSGLTAHGDASPVAAGPYDYAGYSESLHGGSYVFDGSGDYLSVDLGDNLIDSNTPFTVEFWMYPENISNRGILHFTNNPGTLETTLYISGAGNLSWFDSRVGSAAAGDITPNSGGGITTNEWHHIALTRQSDNYVKIYVDGQLYNTSSNVWDLGLSRYLEVGRYANTAYFDGYVSDLRIIEGTAVYTEDFTPSTAPLEAVTGTSLLLSGNNAAIRDESQSVESISVFGNTTVVEDSPYGTGKSIEFDGSTGYIWSPDHSGVRFNTGDFTAECWFKLDAFPYDSPNRTQAAGILGKRSSDFNSGAYWRIACHLNGTVSYQTSENGSSARLSSQNPVSLDTWYHIAVSRSAGIVTLYLNGVAQDSRACSDNLDYVGEQIVIGNLEGAYLLNGNVSDVRLVKGTAIYTENFSVPTAPLGDYSESTPAPAPAPAPEPATTYLTNAIAQNISGDGAWGVGAVSISGNWTGTFDASTGKYTKTSTAKWGYFLDSIDLSGVDQGDEFWFIVGAENMSTEFSNRGYMWNWARTSSESPKFFPVDDGGTAYIQIRSDTGQFEDNVGSFTPLNINLESGVIGAHTQLLLANRYTKSTGKMDTWYSTENPSIGIENITWTKLYNYDLTAGESLTEIKLGGLVREGTGQVIRLWDASADNVPV